MIKRVIKLHTELVMEDMSDRELELLRKHSLMKKSISRDVLIPFDMTLHSLHYVLQKLYGWENSHLHSFVLPDDVFMSLTRNRFMTWKSLCGVYFRYPHENYDDIYWGDNYRESQNFNNWLKKKYTGPYQYLGMSEHALIAKGMVSEFMNKWPVFKVYDPIIPDGSYVVECTKATMEDVQNAFCDFNPCELIERCRVGDLLSFPGETVKSHGDLREDVLEYYMDYNMDDELKTYNEFSFGSEKQRRDYLESFNCPVSSVSDELVYLYDYGDGWKIKITCVDIYDVDEQWHTRCCDCVSDEQLNHVVEKHCPLCVSADGLSVLDDIGGIHGYCDMLKKLYDFDLDDDKEIEAHYDISNWIEYSGWKNRMKKPEKML